MQAKRFAGLDGLRFISISFVVLHHLITFKGYFGFDEIDFPVIGTIGLYGIHFFFMGSGFLITYLLLTEEKQFGKINLRNFFLRRILRIWPAYFLLVFVMLSVYQLPFFDIPELTQAYRSGGDQKSNMLYLGLLPHIAPFVNSTAPYVHQTYTIGIEEQFYLIWGVAFFCASRHFKYLMICLAISAPLFNWLHLWLFRYTSDAGHSDRYLIVIKQALYYYKYSKIPTFAIGSLLGYAYFNKDRWIFLLQSKWVQVALYSLLALSLWTGFEIPFIQFEYMALITGLVMMTATFRNQSIINFSNPYLEYLGKISYGIYLFHIFAIVFAVKWLGFGLNLELNSLVGFLLLAIVTLGLSVLFGFLSYYLFELKFLSIKNKLKKVHLSDR